MLRSIFVLKHHGHQRTVRCTFTPRETFRWIQRTLPMFPGFNLKYDCNILLCVLTDCLGAIIS